MNDNENNIKSFIERWLNRGDEKSDTQLFWLEFLEKICGVKNPGELIEFEKRVSLRQVSFIDAYISKTRIIIEQKSLGVDLDKPEKQSDGSLMTPFEQAKRYSDWLPASEHARWIITSNFQEIRVYDMERPKAEPEIIFLEDLEGEWRKFLFMADPKGTTPRDIHEERVSQQAGALVLKLKESLKPRYRNITNKDSFKSLTVLCVRIVFLLYAEDSGLFKKSQFHDYLESRKVMARDALIKLFDALSQDIDERDFYTEEELKKFPYVNGGLFTDKNIEIPQLDGEPLRIILEDMSESFDWSGINPTIFGAIFERVLNDSERESGGMHYTTIENIHKVIDPLFLDELEDEFKRTRSKEKLRKFREKLASLKFFDPACGSGNFLTEAYLSLCRLEMKVIDKLHEIPLLSVNIEQFYGIEINDFAVAVAKTALWISSIQMAKECNPKIDLMEECLPLEKFDKNIIEGNALTLDWHDVIAPNKLNFIMGNPPFIGYSNQNDEQKKEILAIYVDEKGKPYKSAGKIDYVAGWFFKAAEFIQGTKIPVAFVATNSITQGEQVANVFEPLKERFGIHIDFAWQSFKWTSEIKNNAQVHVVIIAFSVRKNAKLKKLFTGTYLKDDVIKYTFTECEKINFYLVPGDEIFIKSRLKPICEGVPEMTLGNLPRDGGNLILTPQEKDKFLEKNPQAQKFVRRYVGSVEFINNEERYCLWLLDSTPRDLTRVREIVKRVKAVRAFRVASKREATQIAADTSWLFAEIRQPSTNYIAIPLTSGESRDYIPIGFMSPDVIISNAISVIPDASLYHFGILTSRVHMAWMRVIAGRLGISYRYSNTVVYNNFVWPDITPPFGDNPSASLRSAPPLNRGGKNDAKGTQLSSPLLRGETDASRRGVKNRERLRAKIEQTAQKILDVRAKFPKNSLADLYSHEFMPKELRKAHQDNDAAVCEAYGWDKDISEEEIVSELMRLYQGLTQ